VLKKCVQEVLGQGIIFWWMRIKLLNSQIIN